MNLFLGGTRVTSDNVMDFERQYQTRKKAYDTAIGRRGFLQAAGAYRFETVEPCDEKPISGDATLSQDAFRLELRLEPVAAGQTGIPGAIVEATLVIRHG